MESIFIKIQNKEILNKKQLKTVQLPETDIM